jgi:translation initiation factor 5B
LLPTTLFPGHCSVAFPDVLSRPVAQDKEKAEAAPAKGKKVSGAVLAMQREIEERRKAEEAAAAAAEQERLDAEREKLEAEEAAKRAEEEKIARAEAKRLKREQMRKEGKLLTAKQKAEQSKLEMQRAAALAAAEV